MIMNDSESAQASSFMYFSTIPNCRSWSEKHLQFDRVHLSLAGIWLRFPRGAGRTTKKASCRHFQVPNSWWLQRCSKLWMLSHDLPRCPMKAGEAWPRLQWKLQSSSTWAHPKNAASPVCGRNFSNFMPFPSPTKISSSAGEVQQNFGDHLLCLGDLMSSMLVTVLAVEWTTIQNSRKYSAIGEPKKNRSRDWCPAAKGECVRAHGLFEDTDKWSLVSDVLTILTVTALCR